MAGEGTVYVADPIDHRVQQCTAEGAFLNQWGDEDGGQGPFGSPEGLAVAGDGTIYLTVYVTDSGDYRVQHFTADGVLLNQWGSLGSGVGQFEYPGGLAVAGDGTVYVADRGNNRIQVFTADGDFIAWWGRQG